jgi:hypothetical protein
MSGRDDGELLARFNDRLRGIEAEIGTPPTFDPGRVRASTKSVASASLTRRTLGIGGLAVVVLVVALLAGLPRSAGQGPLASPAQASASAPAAQASPSPSPEIVLGADGLPTSIRGEPVLTVPEALMIVRAATPATFLVRGMLGYSLESCLRVGRVNTGGCGTSPFLSPPGLASPGPFLWTIFLPGTSPAKPPPGQGDDAFALRVHAPSSAPGECVAGPGSQCDQAVIVDAIEWSGTWTPPAAAPSPTPTPPLTIVCSSPDLKASWCPAVEMKVMAAVKDLGFPIQRIAIESTDFPCGVPWLEGPVTPLCPGIPIVGAFVAFDGTNVVAALEIERVGGKQPTAKIVQVQVPPTGWTMP